MRSSRFLCSPLRNSAALASLSLLPIHNTPPSLTPPSFSMNHTSGSGSSSGGCLFRCSPALLQLFRPSLVPLRAPRSAARGSASHKDTNVSLAQFFPELADTWITASSNKMLLPQNVSPGSRKLAWWRCSHDSDCGKQFKKRIDLHVASGGECPHCHRKVPLAANKAKSAASSSSSNNSKAKEDEVRRAKRAVRCRPDSSLASVINEDNANRIKKSVAEESLLTSRNLNVLPMLAKGYDKEHGKIAEDEVIYISPKLDGIRCLAAYDARAGEVLFFSRSGTLFECCDFSVSPALEVVFKRDPLAVLDGELYMDRPNQRRIAQSLVGAMGGGGGGGKKKGGAANSNTSNDEQIFLLSQLAANVNLAGTSSSSSPTATNAAALRTFLDANTGPRAAGKETDIPFEKIVSAVRTMRKKRDSKMIALQSTLQFHVFDVLYSQEFLISGSSERKNEVYISLPFRGRYAFLQRLLSEARQANTKRFPKRTEHGVYIPDALRLVPAVPCVKSCCEAALTTFMSVGYEGLMVRRDSTDRAEVLTIDPLLLLSSSSSSAAAKGKGKGRGGIDVYAAAVKAVGEHPITQEDRARIAKQGCKGRYGYGERSSTLLKYKVMQDQEFIIVGTIEGKGKWKGQVGAFVCETKPKDPKGVAKTFTVAPASTDAEKKRIWRNKASYVGKALTVQYQSLGADGTPRFPVGKGIRGLADGSDWI